MNATIAVESAHIEPREFFEKYVLPRKPVILDGFLADPRWKGSERWTNDYLIEKAGEEVVKVERRDHGEGRFGLGREERMRLADFLRQIESGDETLYLTTQDLEHSVDGRPSILSSPVTKLTDDFPLRPNLTGNLVLQNANIWIGSSQKESTSGLHHDHHDNVYVLLRGQKRFVLFSPEHAHKMYTVGEIEKIHPNGRICYKGQVTRADGSHLNAEAALNASNAVTAAALALEQVIFSFFF